MNLNKYNPFPLPVLGMFLIIFIFGYFIGGAISQLAQTRETRVFIHSSR